MELVFRGCIKEVEVGTYSYTYKIIRRGKTCSVTSIYFDNCDILKRGTMVEVYNCSHHFYTSIPITTKLGRVREEGYWK